MMTREEFLNELEYADDVLYPGKFSPYARNIAAHDQAQRAVIEQQAKEIENLKSEMRHWTLERFNQLGQENQTLRAALQAIVKIRFLLGNDPKLNPAYEMGDIAKQALKDTTT